MNRLEYLQKQLTIDINDHIECGYCTDYEATYSPELDAEQVQDNFYDAGWFNALCYVKKIVDRLISKGCEL